MENSKTKVRYQPGYGLVYCEAHDVGYGSVLAKGLAEQPDPLDGYSNLTEAIKAGDPIDWEKLDGKKVQCVNPEVGELRGVLVRNSRLEPDTPDAWWDEEGTASYINALYDGWNGNDGWSLYIEGDIPMRRKTAYELEVGTYFLGEVPGYMAGEAYVGGEEFGIGKRVHRSPSMIESSIPASEWVVLEEYGTFQKPEGE